ncbi:MAPEG family protein [Pelagibacterium limicola]|uniref:MAPEG family protein n=1 Tax=Pelagibacterium limicola TaxID=2791022 RepID=UPI0018B00492|nr:MAPEG family protein [Pelagibacterium limicola]
MSGELNLLVWSVPLVAFYVLAQSVCYRLQHGVVFAGGARDGEAPPNVLNGRAERALRNLLETYAVFVALVVAVELSGRGGELTLWGAHLYFWSRWAYLPLYLAGIPYLRSAIWIVSAVGLILMFAGIVV